MKLIENRHVQRDALRRTAGPAIRAVHKPFLSEPRRLGTQKSEVKLQVVLFYGRLNCWR